MLSAVEYWGHKIAAQGLHPIDNNIQALHELHEGHPGITHMKALARNFVWWPQVYNDLEELVKTDGCHSTQHLPPVAPLQP